MFDQTWKATISYRHGKYLLKLQNYRGENSAFTLNSIGDCLDGVLEWKKVSENES